ncbi:MAG: D-mannonate epimerase, partial [Phycisphaerales bacterium]
MLLCSRGNERDNLSGDDLKQGLSAALDKLGTRRKVLALPPDITRLHSRSGELTRYAWQYCGKALTDVLPALGTHFAMTGPEIKKMFGEVPAGLFRVHDWRNGFDTLGEVPPAFIREVSEGKLDWSWPAQVSKLIAEGGHD